MELMKMNVVKQWSLGVTVVGAIAFGNITSAQAFNLYTITDLGDFGGGESYASDINESGQIVGYSHTADGNQRGFLWENGTMTDLGTLGGGFSSAYKINNAGQIVGGWKQQQFPRCPVGKWDNDRLGPPWWWL